MPSLLDTITSSLGPDAFGVLGRQIGADPESTRGAVTAALPMLLGALARNSRDSGGADSLSRALQRHDGSVLSDVASAITSPNHAADGAGILGHVFGNRQPVVANGLSQVSGLDSGAAGQLLAMLAPVVMGALGQQAQQQGLNPSGLAGLLGQQHAAAQQGVPSHHQSLLTSLLDRDGDGKIGDDVGRMGLGILGNLFNRQ